MAPNIIQNIAKACNHVTAEKEKKPYTVAILLAAGIAVTVSGCGVLTTKNIIQKDETQTKTEKVDTEKKEEQ